MQIPKATNTIPNNIKLALAVFFIPLPFFHASMRQTSGADMKSFLNLSAGIVPTPDTTNSPHFPSIYSAYCKKCRC
jgi:hypothetical protein